MSLHEEKLKSEALASRTKIRDLRNEIIRLQSALEKTKAKLQAERTKPPVERIVEKPVRQPYAVEKIVYRPTRDQRLIDELADTKRQLAFYKNIALARQPDLAHNEQEVS